MQPDNYEPGMGRIKKVRCEFICEVLTTKTGKKRESRICIVDADGWGSCGDAIYDTEPCVWIQEILEIEKEVKDESQRYGNERQTNI